jgi:hypothetical protein
MCYNIKIIKSELLMKRTLKYTYNFFLHGFALVGLALVGGFFAVRFHITDVKGAVDSRSQDFGKMVLGIESQKTSKAEIESEKNSVDILNQQIAQLAKTKELRLKNICTIDAIGYYSPINAKIILSAFESTKSDLIVSKMIFAASLRLTEAGRDEEIKKCDQNWEKQVDVDYSNLIQKYSSATGSNAFPWMNDDQWQTIKIAIARDRDKIKQAAQIAKIEPRLIVSNTIVEQLRLFHSQRELYKKFFEPLKILGNSNKISLGVMGIKEATAIATENNLKDVNSQYYLGPEFEHVLDFSGGDIAKERYDRLTTEGEYYYSYLYGGIYLKEMMSQWENAGFDIKYRPEIVGTLFNVGFPQSHPNSDPKVGGSEISIGEAKYSFGSLAYEFYYSGELLNEFPFIVEN